MFIDSKLIKAYLADAKEFQPSHPLFMSNYAAFIEARITKLSRDKFGKRFDQLGPASRAKVKRSIEFAEAKLVAIAFAWDISPAAFIDALGAAFKFKMMTRILRKAASQRKAASFKNRRPKHQRSKK